MSMTAEDAYEILFRNAFSKWGGWPEVLEPGPLRDGIEEILRTAAKGQGGAAPSDLAEGEYPGARFLPGWVLDTAEMQGVVKPILRAMVSLPLAGGGETTCRFEWIIDDLLNKDGTDLSGGFRSIMAAGVTDADLTAWQRGGELIGLDRNKGTAVIGQDKGGYFKVKYFNPPGGRVTAKAPPSRAQTAQIGQQMLATLARLKKSTPTGTGSTGTSGPGRPPQ